MTVHSPCKRTAPFLRRTWLRGVKALQESSVMGNIISSPMHKLPQVPHHGEANEARPTKRRRISSPDALDIDHLIASPRMSESGSTLRIEVLKILHKDSKRVKSYQPALPCDVLAIKARCKVTILDTSSGPPQVLHCQSQMCDLTTFKNPAGPHRVARVDLPRPFFVPHYSILINRPDDGGFDLSDSYQVLIELESANSIHWPPLDSHDFGIPAETLYSPWCTTQHWTLSSRFDAVFGRLKNPLSLSTRYPSDQSSYQTNYVMDVDLRWTAGLKTPRQLDKGSMSCITAVDPDSDLFSNNVISPLANGTVVNGINGHVDAVESPKDHEDEFGGDQTPSRSLRARAKNKVYNLKILSDQQLERDKKQRGQSPHEATSQGRVQYLLPSDQPISLDFYRCISCGAYHESMDQLRLHLQHWHPHFEYILENSNQGPLFRVSPLRELTASPQRTHCLVRTAKPFSIQTLSSGDQSWLKSRLGPDGDEPFRSPVKATLGRLSAGSPVAKVPQPATRRLRGAQVKKALVPDISLPLFHPISKARLKAGQEVPQPIPDNTWLIQKHRESISDFSDVTPAEKEYIWEWDGYILRQNITSAAYFARAWLSFVAEKAAWLVGAEHRMLEFAKHCSVLLARDVLGDEDMQQAFRCINDARTSSAVNGRGRGYGVTSPRAKDEPTKQSPRASQIRKSANGCRVCQLPVIGPRLLLCSNTACLKRLYHADCIKKDALGPVLGPGWLCNDCTNSRASD